eukprot:2241561-Rhodomonas_salina.8
MTSVDIGVKAVVVGRVVQAQHLSVLCHPPATRVATSAVERAWRARSKTGGAAPCHALPDLHLLHRAAVSARCGSKMGGAEQNVEEGRQPAQPPLHTNSCQRATHCAGQAACGRGGGLEGGEGTSTRGPEPSGLRLQSLWQSGMLLGA